MEEHSPRGGLSFYSAGSHKGVWIEARKEATFLGAYKEESRESKIKKEENRLKRIFKDLDKNKKNTVLSLIKNAAFMSVTLDELQEEINKNGCVSEYQNGKNQHGTKKSPEVDIHISMTKNHAAIIKQLCELVPPEKKKDSRLQALRDE